MLDYKKLGFKCGLEVHVQLDTKKLFCQCPSLVNDPSPVNFIITRNLRATEGEAGEKDVAAEFEEAKKKTFLYEGTETSSCLVDFDDEPPHTINKEAIEVALQVASILNMKIVPEILVMRKIVIDGSMPSGFQRTALIGRDGFIATSKGKINIQTLYLEEEAAKKILEAEEIITYRLDRLGIPLLEIATSPDLQDPEHVKETASLIGMIVKSTGKAKPGIGSIRQDVNISIREHPRVELKGFQDFRSIPKVLDIEIERQQKTKEKSHVRKVEPNFTTSFLRPMPSSARLYPETDIPNTEITKQLLNSIKIPELITDRAINFEKKYNLPPQYAQEIIKKNIPFDYYAEKYCLEPRLIANTLIEVPKELKARFNTKQEPKQQHFEFIFDLLAKKQIQKDAIMEILKDLVENRKPDLSKYGTVSLEDLEMFIKELAQKNPGVSSGGLMGDIMKKYRGSVDGKLVMKILNKYKKA